MTYDKPVFARVSEEIFFKIEKIKDKHHFSNREVLEFAVDEYMERNPIFASHVMIEWINRLKDNGHDQNLENEYTIDNLFKKLYKSVISLEDQQKFCEENNVEDINDLFGALNEIRKTADKLGGVDNFVIDDWREIGTHFFINHDALREFYGKVSIFG